MRYEFILGQIIVGVIVQAPALWLAGRFIVGTDRAKFMDAVWITVLGAILNAGIAAYISDEIAWLVQLVAYLYLVKQYYETSWVSAFVISIVAVIILVVALFVLAMLGLGLMGPSFGGF